MSTKDEKDWLRAILEGSVNPGDVEWERIWQDENFTGVRRVLREVGMQKKDELEHTYLFEEGTETKVTYGEKTVTLNRLKAAKRDGVGNKTR